MLGIIPVCSQRIGIKPKMRQHILGSGENWQGDLKQRIPTQSVSGVKVTTSGFNSRADSKSKSHIHMGPICNGSGVMSFWSTVNKLERKEGHCVFFSYAVKCTVTDSLFITQANWSWQCTELAIMVTGSEPIRLACVGLHESYGVCTQGEHKRTTTPANSQCCKKHQQHCSAS